MDNNILNKLDTTIGYDDEASRINKKEIEEMVSVLERDVNCFGFNPEKIYTSFREDVDNSGRGKNLSDPKMAYRYAEFRLFQISLQWIYFWATTTDETHNNSKVTDFYPWVDPRNEISVKRCWEIAQMAEFKDLMSDYSPEIDYTVRSDDVIEEFYKQFMRIVNTKMHRTNVQTATGLMVYAACNLEEENSRKLKNRLTEEYGDRFYRFPLI